jgi:hypothetical protein
MFVMTLKLLFFHGTDVKDIKATLWGEIMTKYEVSNEFVGKQITLVSISNENSLKGKIDVIPDADLRNMLYLMTLAAKTGKEAQDRLDNVLYGFECIQKVMKEAGL